MVDRPIVMLFLTAPVLQCPRLCLMELIYSLWRIPCISMGSGIPVLTVNVLSIKLDGIAPFISPVLSESRREHGETFEGAQDMVLRCHRIVASAQMREIGCDPCLVLGTEKVHPMELWACPERAGGL